MRDLAPVTTRALRHAAGVRSVHGGAGPAMLVIPPGGNVESMTADAEAVLHDLRTQGLGGLATPTPVIEPARATDLVPILLESYGLTERGTEVVLLLARGLATKEIAAELCISIHTVNDHIKVIFTKVGVSSRGELVARLFSDHVLETYHGAVVRVP